MQGDFSKPANRMLWVLGMRDLSHREARVLACIAFHDGPRGAWPSLERIASEAGMLRGRVVEAIAALCGKGRLVRVHGRHSNQYRVVYGDPVTGPETRASEGDSHWPGNRGSHWPGNPGGEQEERGARIQRWRVGHGPACSAEGAW